MTENDLAVIQIAECVKFVSSFVLSLTILKHCSVRLQHHPNLHSPEKKNGKEQGDAPLESWDFFRLPHCGTIWVLLINSRPCFQFSITFIYILILQEHDDINSFPSAFDLPQNIDDWH